jgi:hypothetical protein
MRAAVRCPSTMKRARRALTALLPLLFASACLNAQGSFEELAWSPTASSFALADRHDLVVSRGTVVATRRAEGDQRLTLFFSGASVQANDHWRGYSFTRLLELRRELSTRDALLIDGVPLEDVAPGASFVLEWTGSGRITGQTFDAAMVIRPQVATTADSSPIGERSTITLTIDDADAKAGGFVSGTVEVTRARSDDQEDDVATGTVTLTFNVPVVAERRGKSNLAIARPILVCAAEKGPTRSAGCRDAEPEPELDPTSLQSSL